MKALMQRYQTVVRKEICRRFRGESRIWAFQEKDSVDTIFVFHQFLVMGNWRYIQGTH